MLLEGIREQIERRLTRLTLASASPRTRESQNSARYPSPRHCGAWTWQTVSLIRICEQLSHIHPDTAVERYANRDLVVDDHLAELYEVE